MFSHLFAHKNLKLKISPQANNFLHNAIKNVTNSKVVKYQIMNFYLLSMLIIHGELINLAHSSCCIFLQPVDLNSMIFFLL